MKKILAVLTPKGLVSRRGNAIRPSSLRAVLSNPFYAGNVRFGTEVMAGKHEPLVTRELFEQVMVKLRVCARIQLLNGFEVGYLHKK